MKGKYSALNLHVLRSLFVQDPVCLSFAEIEVLLGATLPQAARRKGFWSSSRTALANWRWYGIKAKPDVQAGRVVFVRDAKRRTGGQPQLPDSGRHPDSAGNESRRMVFAGSQ